MSSCYLAELWALTARQRARLTGAHLRMLRQLVRGGGNQTVPFQVSSVGIYLVVQADNGLILMWDKKTSIFIKITPTYKVHTKLFSL